MHVVTMIRLPSREVKVWSRSCDIILPHVRPLFTVFQMSKEYVQQEMKHNEPVILLRSVPMAVECNQRVAGWLSG